MSKREAFLEAACKENVEGFLRFIQLHKDKAEPFDVEEVLQEMPREQREALWRRLASLLQDVLLEFPTERGEGRGEEGGMQEEPTADSKRAVAVVDGVTLVSTVSLQVLQDDDHYSPLLEVTRRLHDVLVSLPVSEAPLQNHIHALCEAWWKKGLQEKERFGRTAFFVSLQKSFILKKPGAEIQRVWRLHDVLLSLDYTSEENKQIIDLLLQCFHRPAHIRNDDGKRFLVFLFSWNVNFIWVIHGTIKNQLEFYSKPITAHIAEIYFRAWKKASGEFLEKIESLCIQDFMQNAIFLHRASPVHSKVRQIVSYFHMRKDCRNVDKMLYNLYKPILWKALSAPNFEVRANSTLLFTEAFPFYDPSESNEKIDENIQKQLDTAMNLLDDPHPTVRSNATLGVCKILAKCWELLPPTIITDFMKKLVAELAADSSSPDVRCSVFKCLTIVLDNALSHPLLEKLLPTLKYSLHDNSEKDKATSGRKVCIMETVEAKPDLALAYLEHLFSHTSTREKVLALGAKPLKQLHTVLGNWKLVLYSHLSSTTEDPKHASVDTALNAFKHHGRLGAHLQHNLSDGRDYLLSLEHVAAWVADRVLPFLAKRSDDDSEDSEKSQPQPLAAEISESFLTVCRDVLLVGLGDETFKGQILHLCSLILLSEAGYLCIPAVLPILKEVANSYAPEDSKEPEEDQEDPTTVILGVVSNIFQKIIELLARRLRKDPEEGKQLCQSAVPGLTDFLQVAQLWDRAPLSGVFSTLFAVIVVEKRHLLQKIEHPEAVIIPESMDDMPPLSRILLSVLLKSQPVTRAFLAEVCTSVDSEAIGNPVELAAVLHVLAVIKHAGQSKAGLKSAAVSVQQQLYKHAVTFADSTDVQRVIYESSVTTLNEILHL
ncbi:condensin-2 complex subunit G2 [Neolamprologus brichardi]|uniref:condensin-2 complex subunit G2 n=1 Tax=Neolamprologus brichardi TaxID=32507 RepID=UPI001643C746|nr:condensin-2 complex subunit G2 [Neolamprologus brichardi]